MEQVAPKKSLNVSLKSFITCIAIVFALMVVAYVLTFVLPAGQYARDDAGKIITTTENPYGIYNTIEKSFEWWKFLLSPFLVLGSDGNVTLIAILVFLLVIGGTFSVITEQNLIEYLLNKVVSKYYKQRYVLVFLLPLIFMLLASTAGCFEEIIPLVPIIVALAISLGWNNMVGLMFSIIACACGYAAGIINPFGTVVAQRVAGEVVFSGSLFRIIIFIILYLILALYLFFVCRWMDKKNKQKNEEVTVNFVKDKTKDKALLWFGICLGIGILFIICSTFITALQDLTLIFFALCFFIGGVVASVVSGLKGKRFFKVFWKGIVGIAPSLILILFASSIKYILTESSRLDTLVYYFMGAATGMNKIGLILFIYAIVLIMEFFVPSGSAKAFLLIPLLIPISQVMGIPTNLVVLAYIFGDGLANVIYPTNPGLLISLNLADTNYPKYMKATWKLFLILFAVTCGILVLSTALPADFINL